MKGRKMKKLRILILALCVCLIAGAAEALNMSEVYGEDHNDSHCICGVSDCTKTGAEAEGHTADNTAKWTAWDGTSEIDYGDNNTAYVYLTQDVATTSCFYVKQGETLYLCLNGHTISKNTSEGATENSFGATVVVDNGANLTLCDCVGTGNITHGTDSDGITYNGRGVRVGQGRSSNGKATFTMYGGRISGNHSGNAEGGLDGAGVELQGADFNMYGGEISNNYAEVAQNYGVGGVFVQSGSVFNMHGGTIKDNSSVKRGGGVCVWSAKFNMYGGTISGNTAKENGGGVALYNGNFNLTGGEIKNNSAQNGGGVYLYDSATSVYSVRKLIISGDVNISNNNVTGNGGGVYVYKDTDAPYAFVGVSGNVNISGNVQGGTISNGNLSGGTANNVYLPSGKTINIVGELTGSNPIGVTTENIPDANGYVEIAQADNAEWAVPDKFSYENDDTGIVRKTSGSTTYLMACKHDYSGSWISDNNDHWHTCSNCDVTDTKTAHEYNQQIASESYLKTAATCTSKAVYYKSCVCGKAGTETFEVGEKNADNHAGTLGEWQSDENNHWQEYNCCNARANEAEHSWDDGRVTKEASCIEEGVKTFTCKVCNKEKTENINAAGHSYTAETKSDAALKTPGTCIAEAVYYYSCAKCGAVEKNDSHTFTGELNASNHAGTLGEWQTDNDNHWKVYSCCNAEAEKAEHTWDNGKVTKAATCEEKGTRTFTCTDCNAAKTEDINAAGHSYTAETKFDDTLKTPGTCIAEAIYYYSCANCGAVEKNDSHTFAGEKDADNHTGALGEWQTDNDNHWKVYSCCKAEADKTEHTWDTGKITKEASCTEAGSKVFTCGICKKEKTETLNAKGHDYTAETKSDDTLKTPGTCVAEAVYYYSCIRCGTVENSDNHTFKGEKDADNHTGTDTEWVTTATTHKEIYKCCNAVKTAETEHTWDAGVITTPATTTSEGVKTFTCEVCKAAREESIPKRPSGGGKVPPKTDTITANVTGDKTSVEITAEISGNTASVAEISKNDIDKAGSGADITIDLTVLPKEIVSVTVTKKSLENIYDSEADNVSIKLTGSTVNIDRDTLRKITDQMKGSDLKLVVDNHQNALESMNKAQKDTVNGMKNPKLMDAYFISGGVRITDFKGGSVDIKVPYPGKKEVRAWYIDDNGGKEQVPVSYDGKTAVITVSHFSHYAIEEHNSDTVKPVPVKKTVDKVIYVKSIKYSKKTGTEITFNKVDGADGYYIYGNRCNTDKVYKYKKLATLKGKDNTVFVHKKTAKNTFYKYYIRAYKVVDGKRVTISTSREIHFVTDVKGYKYGNPTKVTLSVKKHTLSRGKTFNLKNRVKVYSSKKVLLHTDKVRYVSSDSSVAKVNSKGKITAKKAGSCNIYAIAQNGRAAKIAVTVK